jgi:hypothetical protein
MDQFDFEKEVIKIASHLWPEAFGGGSEVVNGSERDGVFITEDSIQLIECTISRTKDKAEKDVKKLSTLAREMQRKFPEKAVKAWFITKDEPTADQRAVVNSQGYLVTSCSFEKFQSKLIDPWNYFNCRNNYPFGSVRDPLTGDYKNHEEYVDIDFVDMRIEESVWNIEKITNEILSEKKILVQGHYGVGKSMALKEVYRALHKKYSAKSTVKFPIYINLRDHHGQTNAVEAIERHARNIGFKNPEHIVRAWRAGYTVLILDGFDEIAAFGWAGKTSTLKEIRYKSMELVREFIKQNPINGGLLLSGRINYFDSIKECERAFNISYTVPILKIGDFTQEQVKKYLEKRKINPNIPNWIPTRPLLLGYLVAKGILTGTILKNGINSPAEGWDLLLDEISKREAAIEAGLTPETIREIIEGLASVVRKSQSGLGPLFQDDLERVFTEKCGYPPDDRALVLLQRLPGLAPQDQQDGSRYFIDEMLASAAKAGEVIKYIHRPYDYKLSCDPRKWQEALDDVGIESIANKIEDISSGVLEEAILNSKRNEADVLAVDIVMALNYIGKPWTRESVVFSDIIVPTFEIKNEIDWSRVKFQDVIFKNLIVEEMPEILTSPSFCSCIIGTLIGCSDSELLPKPTFESITVDNYEVQKTTTTALLNLSLPNQVKIGLTILKKLYLQSGGGRQENSFYRGLTVGEQAYIPSILEFFKQEGIAIPSKRSGSNKVWQYVKPQSGRIRHILIDKNYKDEFIVKLGKITA